MGFYWIAFSCILLLVLGQRVQANPMVKRATVATEFIILHNNDMHARFEQTNINSGKCTPQEANTQKCYGGFARVAYEVRKYRAEAKNGGTPVFYLNAGDTYTGTPWFTIFKDNITAEFLNRLKPDAISLGNHEFDKNVDGLIPFLNNVDFPVLTCNLDLTKVPELQNTKHLKNSTILELNGVKIGVIGYLTPDTKQLTFKNDVEFYEEVKSINIEAEKLKAQGINIIIALGHSGYLKDQEIGKKCPDVDIVIGGHTNTFLYNGAQPDAEKIDGPYPTLVVQKSGKKVPVVQAYAYTKYLGKLHVQFDANGNLIEFDGSPILLNASVEQEKDLLDLLEVYRPNLTALETETVGNSRVNLDGKVCRVQECNLGNLITDSMVYARLLEERGENYWTDAPIAVIQGGGIRSSLSSGTITGSDVLSVLPFENDLYVTRITGKLLRNSLERSATIRNKDSNGGFLQVSGIRVEYDMKRPEGHRVVSVTVRCSECSIPSYSVLNETKYYNVIMPQFLLENGDGHVFIDEHHPYTVRMRLNDNEAFSQYLKQQQFVYPYIDNRIVFKSSSQKLFSSALLSLLSTIFIYLLN